MIKFLGYFLLYRMNILIIENEKSPLLDKNLTVEIFLDNKEVIRKGEDERYTKRFS